MQGFWIKGTKEQKCWTKTVQDLRGLIEVFSILPSIESLFITLNYI